MRFRTLSMIVPVILALVLVAPAFAAAAGQEGGSIWDFWKLFWKVVNTIVLIGLLVYFMHKPLAKFLANRTAQVRNDLEEARAAREAAERTIKEYEIKIAGMEKELEKIRAELRRASQMESDKVVANAERMAQGMIDAARVAADQEVRKARAALQGDASRMALEMAEAIIRDKISDADQKRIFEDYLGRVEGMK